MDWSIDHVTRRVKAQDVITHAARTTTLHLVLVLEQFLSSKASPVIQFSVRQHTQQGAFACIDVAHHCDSAMSILPL